MSENLFYRPHIGSQFRHIQNNRNYILIHPHRPMWVVVNETGFKIARLCNGKHTIKDIAFEMASECCINSQRVEKDVRFFLSSLENKGWFKESDDTKNQDSYSLRSVFLQITERCNLHCKHCYTASEPTSPTQIPTDKIFSIIDELSCLGSAEITLSGGEPFTHPDIIDIVKHAARKLRVQLLTNGTLINKETAYLLADLGVRVQVSLDGSTAGVHDRIRGEGAFSRARQGIERLISAGALVNLNLCTVIMRDNLDDLLNIVTLAQDWGVPLLRFIPLRCTGRARTAWEQTLTSTAEYSDFFRQIFAQPHVNIQVSNGLSGLVFSSPRNRVKDRWCPLGCKLDILPSGDVYPCVFMMDSKFCLGNIYHNNLTDIFYTDKLKKFAGNCHSRREKIDRCRDCLWCNFCQSGCVGLAYAYTGSLWGLDDFCQLRQELYPKLIFQQAQEILHSPPTQIMSLEVMNDTC